MSHQIIHINVHACTTGNVYMSLCTIGDQDCFICASRFIEGVREMKVSTLYIVVQKHVL